MKKIRDEEEKEKRRKSFKRCDKINSILFFSSGLIINFVTLIWMGWRENDCDRHTRYEFPIDELCVNAVS